MPDLSVDDRSLYYETRGDAGPWLVLLNGMSQSTANWMSQARHLAGTHRVLLYDARGQGRSTLGGDDVTLDGHVRDLDALLNRVVGPDEPVIPCGFSHGARIALAYGARHPGRVARLVLTSIGDADDALRRTIVRSWSEVLARGGLEAMAWCALPDILGSAFLAAHEDHVEAMVRATLQRNTVEGLAALLDAMQGFPPADEDAARIRKPVLLVTADRDLLVSEASAQRLAARFPDATHTVVHDVGHTVPIEAPDRWRDLVTNFTA